MASKQMLFGADAQVQLRKGLEQLAAAVKVTMGPTGRNVILQKSFGGPEVTKDGESVNLSALEFKLLRYFIEHRGATLGRDELLNRVWGYEAMPYSRTVDVHVSGLRQKIEANPSRPQYVITVHRLGYKFVG